MTSPPSAEVRVPPNADDTPHAIAHRTSHGTPDETSGRRWNRRPYRRLSVSDRVMLALAAIAAVGLVIVTAVQWWSFDRVAEQQIDAQLVNEVDELRQLAGGTDPDTGEPFASVDALLSTALIRNVPGPHEGFLALIDGRVPYVPPFGDRLELEAMEPVVEVARAAQGDEVATPHEVDVDGHDIRFVTVPVSVPGDPSRGVFVVAADMSASDAQFDRARIAQALLVVGTALAIGLVAALTVNHLLRPLRTLSRTAAQITEEDLSERIPEAGADDIAHLTRTVNDMLDRLETAFAGQRALLDDVGHELRTPLTIIRGQLEVMDVGDADDVRETRALVVDEVDRMARLVEELVLLAKSMRSDFVTLREMNVDEVVEALMDRVPTLGARRWRLDHLSGAVIEGDGQRLVQAGLQLAANAVRHTGEDDEIGIGAAIDGDVVRLWVRDTGEGVPAADQQAIFERAVRGFARAADTSSSGLGLSIVAAIAEAHGGRVTLASTHGAGSTFAIELPLAAAGLGDGAVQEWVEEPGVSQEAGASREPEGTRRAGEERA